jgi:beta-lactamase superfamily II metal-dependent hydrolase
MAELTKDTIRIRMYRVGFGDCFLISLPVGDDHAHVLVDCGVHSKGDIGTIQDAVTDALAEAKNKLAIVIATHAHQDHISGFGKCDAQFRACEEVGEVWLPWTEDPKDKTAARLKSKTLALVEQLQMHFAASGGAAKAEFAMMNIAGNEKALQLLKSGIKNGTVRYLEVGGELKNPGGIQGLNVKVLGPPRDQAFLAKMDPPAGERFLRMNGSQPEAANGVKPFLGKWLFNPVRHRAYPALEAKDRDSLGKLSADPEALAFALDQAINNTSVVALFSYRGKYLLFPGDAQYGNWNFWMSQDGSDELLAEIDFYKVGHHGSFNATPKKAVAKMTKGKFAAMASTQNSPWASIPLAKLVAAVEAQASGFVRSDSIPVKNAPKGPALKKLPPGFSQGKSWFDYEIPC